MLSIAESSRGTTKYLHEVCDQLKIEKPIFEISSIEHEKQPAFIATAKMKGYLASKEGKSKQEAKNAAAFELLKQFTQSRSDAERALRMVALKDKDLSCNLQNISSNGDPSAKVLILRKNLARMTLIC